MSRTVYIAALLSLVAVVIKGQPLFHDAFVERSGVTKGAVSKVGGLNAYVTGPSNAAYAVILVTDIYGFSLNNTRLWADRLAKEGGYLVVVPDFFKGDPWTKAKSPSSPEFPIWRAKWKQEEILKELGAVFNATKGSHKSVKKLGITGFCWGGLYAVLATAGKPPPVAAAVAYHPSFVQPANVLAINAPTRLLLADPALDRNFNTTAVAFATPVAAAKTKAGVPVSLRSWPGQAHGFALRGNEGDPAVKKAADEAFADGLAFFKKYLK